MDDQSEEYLTVEELSGKIKFSKQTIYNLIAKGEFVLQEHYLKPRPKKILFKWSAIKAWMQNSQNNSISNIKSGRSDVIKPRSLIEI